MEESYIKQEGQKIEKFLSHSFDKVNVEYVQPEEVTARGPIGGDAEERLDDYQVYYRIKIPSETKQDILDNRGDITEYFCNQLEEMETLSSAPDTLFVYSDNPPEHIKKPLVFYVISTL